MATFVYPQCGCGRTLRASREQMGTTIRCWSCGSQVLVPREGDSRRLALAFVQAAREAVSSTCLGIALAAGALAAAFLPIPRAGVWLLAAFLAAASWEFQSTVRCGESDEPDDDDERPTWPGWRALAVRLGLSVMGALAVLAPFYVRNGGRPLPEGPALGGTWGLPLALFAWWAILPLVLAAANGHDGTREVAPGKVLAALAARPLATLAALAAVPVGLLAVELLLAFAVVEQGYMPPLLNSVFPSPTPSLPGGNVHLIYRYDDSVWDVPFTDDGLELVPVYLSGLRRGYTLLGEVPGSLVPGVQRSGPALFQARASVPLALRFVLSALGFAGAFSVLGLQARWLGSLIAVGAQAETADPSRASPTALPSLADAVGAAPSEPSPARLAMPSTAASPAVAAPSRRPSVLIIDDDADCAEALGRILAGEGLLFATAANAQDGLALAASTGPDLIILDLLLPDRSGLEVCRALRAQETTRDIPVLMLTHRDTAEDEVSGLEQGADDYVAKPYVIEVLLARIRKRMRVGPNGAQAPRREACRDHSIAVLTGS